MHRPRSALQPGVSHPSVVLIPVLLIAVGCSGGDGLRPEPGSVVALAFSQFLDSVPQGQPIPSFRVVTVDASWVTAHTGRSGYAFIDTRTTPEYLGTGERGGLPSKGHIAGARQLEWQQLFANADSALFLEPSAIAKLPRSGAWLNSVKVLMGFVEIATAMKFLANADLVWQWGVFTRTVVLAVWIGLYPKPFLDRLETTVQRITTRVSPTYAQAYVDCGKAPTAAQTAATPGGRFLASVPCDANGNPLPVQR